MVKRADDVDARFLNVSSASFCCIVRCALGPRQIARIEALTPASTRSHKTSAARSRSGDLGHFFGVGVGRGFGHARWDSGGGEIVVALADVVQRVRVDALGSAPEWNTLENWERLQREWT